MCRCRPRAGCDSLLSFSPLRRSPRAAPPGRSAARRPSAVAHTRPGSALAAVAHLEVKGRAPKTGYRRDQFGDGWASLDGCDTRDRHPRAATCGPRSFRTSTRRLRGAERAAAPIRTPRPRSSSPAAARPRSTSIMSSPSATRGRRAPGAGRRAERVAFANDPLNLLAVDASPTARRATATRRPGCRLTRAFAAPTSRARSRSSSSTRFRSRPPSATPCAACWASARPSA